MSNPVLSLVMYAILAVPMFAGAVLYLFFPGHVKRFNARIIPDEMRERHALLRPAPTEVSIRIVGVGFAVFGFFAVAGSVYWGLQI